MTTIYSSIVDANSKFVYQAQLLTWSLLELSGATPDQILLHFTSDCSDTLMDVFASQGINVCRIEPHSSGNPIYKKINQLTNPRLREADSIVLCDADIAFLSSPESFLGGDQIAAKIVDLPIPSESICRTLVDEAGLAKVTRWVKPTVALDNQKTPFGNCNGGLYFIPQEFVNALDQRWNFWAMWLLKMADLLGLCNQHVGQLSFSFCINELKLPFRELSVESNFPLNLSRDDRYRDKLLSTLSEPIKIIHYYDEMDASGFLRNTQNRFVDKGVLQVNSTIKKQRRKSFSNEIFWNYRYQHHPQLGSGIGSRDTYLAKKRQLIYPILEAQEGVKVIDIGCGDLEVMRKANISNYLGIDISEQALEICRTKRPDWHFSSEPLSSLKENCADVTLCLDVLIHQHNEAHYLGLIEQIYRLSRSKAIVAGYNQPPWFTSEITFYYESLSASLRNAGFYAMEILGGYRDITLILASKEEKSLRLAQES